MNTNQQFVLVLIGVDILIKFRQECGLTIIIELRAVLLSLGVILDAGSTNGFSIVNAEGLGKDLYITPFGLIEEAAFVQS